MTRTRWRCPATIGSLTARMCWKRSAALLMSCQTQQSN
nr:MAG TPA: hypothetical protein [Caudoviricetes sp.]